MSATEPKQRFRKLVDLPPSSKLVYYVLRQNGPLAQKDISKRSSLSRRTTREAIYRLRENDIIVEKINLQDAREKQYNLKKLCD